MLVIDGWGIPNEIALIWMSLDFTGDKSILVQVMAWCRQVTSHCLSQCWPRSMTPYVVTRPQWINDQRCNWNYNQIWMVSEKSYVEWTSGGGTREQVVILLYFHTLKFCYCLLLMLFYSKHTALLTGICCDLQNYTMATFNGTHSTSHYIHRIYSDGLTLSYIPSKTFCMIFAMCGIWSYILYKYCS